MKVSLVGVVFLLAITACAFIGSCLYGSVVTAFFFYALLAPNGAPARNVAHTLMSLVSSVWFATVACLLEMLYGLKIVGYSRRLKEQPEREPDMTGLFLPPSEPGKFKIVIANHRTRIDWMLLWAYFARTRSLPTLRIILKNSLMKIPFFGWAMQLMRFIFLSRKWENDEKEMMKRIEYMKQHKEKVTILLFPEGTDLSESNVEKSHAFAKKNNLPIFFKVLNPRTTGIVALKNMIGVENIESVVDLTIGYRDVAPGERPSEAALLSGRMPHELHVLAQEFCFGDNLLGPAAIPSDDEGFAKWIHERFAEKEVLLSEFYSHSPVGFIGCREVTHRFGPSPLVTVILEEVGFIRYVIFPLLIWGLPVYYWLPNTTSGFGICFWLLISQLTIFFWGTLLFNGVDNWFIYRQPVFPPVQREHPMLEQMRKVEATLKKQ